MTDSSSVKKRRLAAPGPSTLVKQESFSDLLNQLEAEEDASQGRSDPLTNVDLTNEY